MAVKATHCPQLDLCLQEHQTNSLLPDLCCACQLIVIFQVLFSTSHPIPGFLSCTFAQSSESNNSPRMMKAHHRDKRHEPISSSMSRSPILRWRRYSSSIALLQTKTRRYSRHRPNFRRMSKCRSCRPRYKLRFRRRLNNRYLLRRRGIEVDILHLVRFHVCLSVSLLAAVLLCGASLNASLSLTANFYRNPSLPIAVVQKKVIPSWPSNSVSYPSCLASLSCSPSLTHASLPSFQVICDCRYNIPLPQLFALPSRTVIPSLSSTSLLYFLVK